MLISLTARLVDHPYVPPRQFLDPTCFPAPDCILVNQVSTDP
jgi:hypothetical protein